METLLSNALSCIPMLGKNGTTHLDRIDENTPQQCPTKYITRDNWIAVIKGDGRVHLYFRFQRPDTIVMAHFVAHPDNDPFFMGEQRFWNDDAQFSVHIDKNEILRELFQTT